MSSYENGKRTRLGRIWNNMKKRCLNERHESYKYYGARGIKVCDEWIHNFDAFKDWAVKNGYHDNLTIDRINPNGDYSPSNCRWATPKQQANNRTNNNYICYNGKTMTLTEWADYLHINFRTLSRRLSSGWSIDKALSSPVDMRYSHNRTVRRS